MWKKDYRMVKAQKHFIFAVGKLLSTASIGKAKNIVSIKEVSYSVNREIDGSLSRVSKSWTYHLSRKSSTLLSFGFHIPLHFKVVHISWSYQHYHEELMTLQGMSLGLWVIWFSVVLAILQVRINLYSLSFVIILKMFKKVTWLISPPGYFSPISGRSSYLGQPTFTLISKNQRKNRKNRITLSKK